MNNKISKATYLRLNRQLQALQQEMINVALPEIERAREFSNNEDNDDMMHARQIQSNYDNRISSLDKLIKSSEVIEKIDFTGRVDYGTDVNLKNVDTGVSRWIRIVGELESTSKAEICFKSAFGMAVMGRTEGDEVEIVTPNGIQYWEILEVKVSSAFSNVSGVES